MPVNHRKYLALFGIIVVELTATGCAPRVTVNRLADLSAGFVKTVDVETRPRAMGKVTSQYVTIDGSPILSTVSEPGSKSSIRRFKLPSSQNWPTGHKVVGSIRTEYRPLGILWKQTTTLPIEITPESTARLSIEDGEECVHEGDILAVRYMFVPQPVFDTIAVSAEPIGNCIVSADGQIKGSLKLKALCEGAVNVRFVAGDRQLIEQASRRWVIKPQLEAPAQLNGRVGGIVAPEAGDTEGGAGPPAPSVVFKELAFTWTTSRQPTEIAIEIWKEGARRADQAALIPGTNNSFVAQVAVGNTYFAKMRAFYNYCQPSESSASVSSAMVVVK